MSEKGVEDSCRRTETTSKYNAKGGAIENEGEVLTRLNGTMFTCYTAKNTSFLQKSHAGG